jgi:hypothetical protein
MGFVNYSFYVGVYYGDSVEEPSFPKWESRAADKLQALCYGRINEDVLREYGAAIQKAECAVMDLMYQLDVASRNANTVEHGNVKSMSSGGQSISFGDNSTCITSALADKQKQERLLYEAAADYLSDTGLLYAGVE